VRKNKKAAAEVMENKQPHKCGCGRAQGLWFVGKNVNAVKPCRNMQHCLH